MRTIVSTLAAMALANSTAAQTLPNPAPPPASSLSVAPSAARPSAGTTTRAPASADTCGATALGNLVGQSRSAIPIADDISKRRVVCTTCPRTQDYRPDRLTVFFDAPTGRVTTLQCG